MLVIGNLEGDMDYDKQILSIMAKLGKEVDKPVIFLSISSKTEEELKEYFEYGASKIYHVPVDSLETKDIKELMKQNFAVWNPSVIATGSNSKNKELASVLATMLEVGLVADCVEIRKQENTRKLVFSRAAINASVIADITCENSQLEMCTVKKDCFQEEKYPCEDGMIITVQPNNRVASEERKKLVEKTKKESFLNMLKLDRDIIIGVGRGAIHAIESIKCLAEKLGADIGCTRPLVDNGDMEFCQQIGQSGKNIKPKVYLALGISGASQHLVGITNAHTILAVNSDSNAPIRNFCDLFICENVDDFLNQILKEL